MGTYMTEAIVLKHGPWREADRSVVMYTRDHGKITAVARSARKISSKLAGSVEPVSLIMVTLVHGRRQETVAGAETLYTFTSLRRSLPAMAHVGLIAEIIDRSTYASQPDPHLYELIERTLRDMEAAVSTMPSNLMLITWRFVWRFLDIVGFRPELYRCQRCHNEIKEEQNWFSYRKGGLICPACHRATDDGRSVMPDVIKILRYIASNATPAVRLKVPGRLIQSTNQLTNEFLNFTHEHDLDFGPFLKLM